LKSKIILTGLFLTTAISCSAYRPLVLTDAYLVPQTTSATYDDLNFSYALFNQYASGLDFTLRFNYSTSNDFVRNNSFFYWNGSSLEYFTLWDTITTNFAEANLTGIWRQRLINVLFNREFDRITKVPTSTIYFGAIRRFDVASVNWELIINSKISYSVSVGSIFSSYTVTKPSSYSFYKYITFLNKDDVVLQSFLLNDNRPTPSGNVYHELQNTANVLTNVRKFILLIQFVDIPPFATDNGFYGIFEFNLFTQNQEISVPNETGGDRFGFEFVAVEWWNILGHLQNFIWWIINQSPIAPVFEWIEDYVITWVSGLITFITGVFRL
jgi:hypothetical protein